MKIPLTSGTGSGPTTLSAFDAALMAAGVTHWNLLHLSSVVPPGAEIIDQPVLTPAEEFGQRRYVVMAHKYAVEVGQEAWAGLGWCQDASGKGLFVEITGAGRADVERDITLTLDSMKARRPFPLGPNRSKLTGIECRGEPVCALVIAVFPGAGAWPP
ncbi:MAG: pyruvoyl-dependent arginine decarboxylase [Azospirillum sp.]|nr:pyruvoyl-dependent arginine decarboxylase [Azospirillum sp.]